MMSRGGHTATEFALKLRARVVRRVAPRVAMRRLRRSLRNTGFSIISQNCIGGCIYHDLGLPFATPTVNLSIPGEAFVRFVEHLPRYLAVEAIPAGFACSSRTSSASAAHPVITVDDIRIDAVHYETDVEAAAAWNRRRVRVDLDNVFVIACVWDLDDDPALVERLGACGYPTVVFSDIPLDHPCVHLLPGEGWELHEQGVVHPLLTEFDEAGLRYCERVFDVVGWLNGRA